MSRGSARRSPSTYSCSATACWPPRPLLARVESRPPVLVCHVSDADGQLLIGRVHRSLLRFFLEGVHLFRRSLVGAWDLMRERPVTTLIDPSSAPGTMATAAATISASMTSGSSCSLRLRANSPKSSASWFDRRFLVAVDGWPCRRCWIAGRLDRLLPRVCGARWRARVYAPQGPNLGRSDGSWR